MSSTSTPSIAVPTRSNDISAPLIATPARPPRRRRLLSIALVVVLVGGTAVWVTVAKPFSSSPSAGVTDNADPTSVTTVAQQSITQQTQVSATLGYGGNYSVVNQAQGDLTWLPAVGQTIDQGQPLYDVNGNPVALLYGATPAYRTLAESTTSTALTGTDVEELNTDLVLMGLVSSADLSPTSDTFGYWTKVGVEALQAKLGETQNGTLALGQYVVLPSAARITALGQNAVLGGQAQPGGAIMSATSTSRVVTIALDAAQQGEVAVGDNVTITLPNNQTTPGKVTSVGTVATTPSGAGNGGSSNPTITVLVAPTDPKATGSIDQAPVEVSITTASDPSALVVPVNALLALANGGYAIEVIGPHGTHTLETVSLGLFDDADGLVAVTGNGVVAGQRIVVPGS